MKPRTGLPPEDQPIPHWAKVLAEILLFLYTYVIPALIMAVALLAAVLIVTKR